MSARHEFDEAKIKRNPLGEFAVKAGGAGGSHHGGGSHGGGRGSAQITTLGKDGKYSTVDTPLDIDVRPKLSQQELLLRSQRVDRTMKVAELSHSTDRLHTKANGRWKDDRAAMHDEIVNKLYGDADKVPNEGKAIIAGGLGGAGKSTVLEKHAGVDKSKFLTINPDDIKEELAKRGMVPSVPGHPDLSPMERSTLIHEESSHIAKMLADKAYADKKNVIWDVTMSSENSVKSRIAQLKGKGYKVNGVFVDIPVETSVERAMDRYKRGVNDYRQGNGYGGRFVPPDIIRKQRTSSGRSVNREVFEGLKHQFDGGHSMYDNSVYGRAPKLIEKSD